MDDKLLTEMAVSLKHIDDKTSKIEKNQEQIQMLISEIQKDNVIAMANNSQLKDRIDRIEAKFEKSKEGIYNKIEEIESETRVVRKDEVNKLYDYIRELFKTEKQENENIKSELRKEFCEQIKINTELIFNKMKLWVYGGIIAIFLMLTKDIIINMIR